MKILFLSRWFPYPADNGSKLRILNLLKGLSRQHEVTLLSFSGEPETSRQVLEVENLCSGVHVVPWREFDPHSMKARAGLFSLKPRSIIDTFSPEMALEITRILSAEKYDLVIASQLPMAAYYEYFNGVPAMFEELELGTAYEESRNAAKLESKLRRGLTWLKLQRYLAGLLKHFQGVTVVSEQERELTSGIFPMINDLLVVPNCIDLDTYRNLQKDICKNRLIFTGSFRYRANYEAMCWFVGKVFPHLLAQMPEAELIITGDHADLPLPSNKNISLTGHIENIGELIASSAVAIAPLLSGGGTRLKILEAMAIGTPVVATSKGAEGLEVRNGEHLWITDDPAEFSDCVLRTLRDEEMRRELAGRARCLVQEKYDWKGVLPGFLDFVESHAGVRKDG